MKTKRIISALTAVFLFYAPLHVGATNLGNEIPQPQCAYASPPLRSSVSRPQLAVPTELSPQALTRLRQHVTVPTVSFFDRVGGQTFVNKGLNTLSEDYVGSPVPRGRLPWRILELGLHTERRLDFSGLGSPSDLWVIRLRLPF